MLVHRSSAKVALWYTNGDGKFEFSIENDGSSLKAPEAITVLPSKDISFTHRGRIYIEGDGSKKTIRADMEVVSSKRITMSDFKPWIESLDWV